MSAENPYLRPMLRALPYFRALLRAVEAGFYEQFDLPAPVLDVGVGDGQFASVAFDQQLDAGLDPDHNSLKEAAGWGAYKYLVNARGQSMPFPTGHFASAISNSVLEHIPDLQPVLKETARLLQPGALFLFCVPNHRWAENLAIAAALRQLGLRGLADAYTRLFIRISRHANLLSPEEWAARLEGAGFTLEDYWHYFPPAALHALEWGHYLGLPSLAARRLFGRWILAPTRWNLGFTYKMIKGHAASTPHAEGTYSWYVARRAG